MRIVRGTLLTGVADDLAHLGRHVVAPGRCQQERVEARPVLAIQRVERFTWVTLLAKGDGLHDPVGQVRPNSENGVQELVLDTDRTGRWLRLPSGNDDVGDDREHFSIVVAQHHEALTLRRSLIRCLVWRSATDMIVAVGFMPADVGNVEPSKMYRLGMSWV